MERIALDTNVVIGYFQGDTDLREKLQKIPVWCLPVTVVGELLFGAYNAAKQEENLIRYQAFIDRTEILGIDVSTAEAYARIRLQLKRSGRPIPENDIWIAATTISHGLPLATRDKHFNAVKGLAMYL